MMNCKCGEQLVSRDHDTANKLTKLQCPKFVDDVLEHYVLNIFDPYKELFDTHKV